MVIDNIHDKLPQDTQLQKEVEELTLNPLEENFAKNIDNTLSYLHKPSMITLLEKLERNPSMFDSYIEFYPEICFDELKKQKTIK